ncbi:MAG: D-alanyl-D-alanine carboxypeptidase, partial [Sinobacteraceae bacterium]|nr:D-alanyl-D-alanine carboxypeptidase [Nevskiaceae bacterium]
MAPSAPGKNLHQPSGETSRRPFTMIKAALLGAALAMTGCLLSPAALAGGLPKLQKMAHNGASISALVVDLDTDKILAGMNPRLRLTPASLTKLVTAAAAFTHWHADHAFTTRVLAGGDIDGDAVHGDLILKGGGDASLDDEHLWSLIAQIRSAGITQIDGNLVVVPAPFGPIACATTDRCKALKSSDSAYDAEVSSIGPDFGTWCVTVHPTQ